MDPDIDSPRRPHALRPIEPSCSRCGYDLRSLVRLSGATCPECGSRLPFDRIRFPQPARLAGDAGAVAWLGAPILLGALIWLARTGGGPAAHAIGQAVIALALVIGWTAFVRVTWPRLWWRMSGLIVVVVLAVVMIAPPPVVAATIALAMACAAPTILRWRFWRRREELRRAAASG